MLHGTDSSVLRPYTLPPSLALNAHVQKGRKVLEKS